LISLSVYALGLIFFLRLVSVRLLGARRPFQRESENALFVNATFHNSQARTPQNPALRFRMNGIGSDYEYQVSEQEIRAALAALAQSHAFAFSHF
jgi:hypothetical protein